MSLPEPPHDSLPWLVNGTLGKAEQDAAQAAIDASPELQRERDFLVALRDSVQQQPLGEAPLELGWHRLQRDIRRERKQGVASGWRLAAVAASLVLLVQSLMLWLPHEGSVHYRPLASSVVAATLQIRFVDNAPQGRIRQLLRQQHLRIVDGPSAAGLYRLASEEDWAVALAALRQRTDLVAYVQAD